MASSSAPTVKADGTFTVTNGRTNMARSYTVALIPAGHRRRRCLGNRSTNSVPRAGVAVDLDGAAVVVHDAGHGRQPQAGAARLGREERLEDVRRSSSRDARRRCRAPPAPRARPLGDVLRRMRDAARCRRRAWPRRRCGSGSRAPGAAGRRPPRCRLPGSACTSTCTSPRAAPARRPWRSRPPARPDPGGCRSSACGRA